MDAVRTQPGDVSRIEIEIKESVDLLSWLVAQPRGKRMYWCGRDGQLELAGWGVAHHVDDTGDLAGAVETIMTSVQGKPYRYMGGVAFDPNQASEGPWDSFGCWAFFLPRLSLEQTPKTTTLAIHLRPGEPAVDFSGVSSDVCTQFTPLVSLTAPTHHPNQLAWTPMAQRAIDAIRGGEIKKVVLARQTTISLDEIVDPIAVLKRLASKQDQTYRFAFELEPNHAFIGCSPEQLFRRDERHIQTEAMAGTRRRGENPAEDAAFCEALTNSAKDICEHDHVVADIQSHMAPLCRSLKRSSQPTIRQFLRVQHLCTTFSGELKSGINESNLLETLHPTPAVCGRPTATAKAFIGHHEPFYRGWYAGPVGWIGDDCSEFAVGIRSALIDPDSIRICAGAGLVSASRPLAEWREINDKSQQFLDLTDQSNMCSSDDVLESA